MTKIFVERPSFTPVKAQKEARALREDLLSALQKSKEAGVVAINNLVKGGDPNFVTYEKGGRKMFLSRFPHGDIRVASMVRSVGKSGVDIVRQEALELSTRPVCDNDEMPRVVWSRTVLWQKEGEESDSKGEQRMDTLIAVEKARTPPIYIENSPMVI